MPSYLIASHSGSDASRQGAGKCPVLGRHRKVSADVSPVLSSSGAESLSSDEKGRVIL